jgi:hypothetical protein
MHRAPSLQGVCALPQGVPKSCDESYRSTELGDWVWRRESAPRKTAWFRADSRIHRFASGGQERREAHNLVSQGSSAAAATNPWGPRTGLWCRDSSELQAFLPLAGPGSDPVDPSCSAVSSAAGGGGHSARRIRADTQPHSAAVAGADVRQALPGVVAQYPLVFTARGVPSRPLSVPQAIPRPPDVRCRRLGGFCGGLRTCSECAGGLNGELIWGLGRRLPGGHRRWGRR